MNYYKLENRTMDLEFLNNVSVSCRVVMREKENIEAGQELIVMLSTGAKYKGKITKVDLIPMGNYTIGEMHIVRQAR
jgi:hypothetical protein